MIDQLFNSRRDAVSLVSHDDKSLVWEMHPVDVFSFQKCPVTGKVRVRELGDKTDKIQVKNVYPEYCSHACLNGFRVKNVCTIVITKYVPDTEPVAHPKYRADVSGVLNPVENHGKRVFYLLRVICFDGDFS